MNNEPITISFLGVDDRSKSAYQLFFEKIKPIRYELIDDYQKAQLCLVDKDSYNIQKQYEELIHNYPQKYILVLSIVEHSCAHNNEFFLQKPIKRDELQKLLNKIYGFISGKTTNKPVAPTNAQIKKTVEKISQKYIKKSDNLKHKDSGKQVTKVKDNTVVSINKTPKASTSNAGKLLKIEHEEYYVGESPDIDINDSAQLKKAYYEPDKLLQSIMEQARIKSQQSGQIVQLNILNHIFYFDDKEQKVHSTAGPAIIRPLCFVYHENEASYDVKTSAFRDDLNFILQASKNRPTNKVKEKHSWSMQAFMWLITLWCSRGRVPEDCDLTQPVYLMQWPNLTRLEPIPHAVRIAALIYHQPRTLTDTAKQLGIEQRYVFAFFSACKTIGLSDISRRDVDKLFATESPKHHKNKSIMSKLLGKLVNFSGNTAINDVINSADK